MHSVSFVNFKRTKKYPIYSATEQAGKEAEPQLLMAITFVYDSCFARIRIAILALTNMAIDFGFKRISVVGGTIVPCVLL